MVAKGFRPKRPKPVPDEIWTIIEACWQQDPAARPAASEVLQQLQQLLQQAQAATGSKSAAGFKLGKLFGRSKTQSSSGGAAAAEGTQLQPGSVDVPADERGKDQSSQQASSPPAVASNAAAAADVVQVLDSSSKDLLLTNGSASSKPAAAVAVKAVPGSSIAVDAGGLAATTATASAQRPKKAVQSEPGCGCVIC